MKEKNIDGVKFLGIKKDGFSYKRELELVYRESIYFWGVRYLLDVSYDENLSKSGLKLNSEERSLVITHHKKADLAFNGITGEILTPIAHSV